MKRSPLNSTEDVPQKIILLLKKKDRPLIANHIAKGVKETPQLVNYHLKNLVEKHVILTQEDYGKTYYLLQPPFYMEDAETALMHILIPWIKEFRKVIDVENDEQVMSNLQYYFQTFLTVASKEI